MRFRNWVKWAPDDGAGGGGGGTVGGAGDEGAPAGGAPASGVQPASAGGSAPKGAAAEPKDPDYYSQISPELRKDPELRKYLSGHPRLNDLVSRSFEMSKRMARALILPSGEKPDPAEVKAFRTRLGIPEKPDGYQFKVDAYKDVKDLDNAVAFVRQQAAGMSLNNHQAQKLLETYMNLNKVAEDQRKKKQKESEDGFEAKLLDALGGSETKKAETLNLYKRAMVKRFGDEETVNAMVETGLFFNPKFAMGIAGMERNLLEEPFIPGSPQGAGKPKAEGMAHSREFDEKYPAKGKGRR